MVVCGWGLWFCDLWGRLVARGRGRTVQAFERLLPVVDEALDGDVGVESGGGTREVGEGEEGSCTTKRRGGRRSIVREGGHRLFLEEESGMRTGRGFPAFL